MPALPSRDINRPKVAKCQDLLAPLLDAMADLNEEEWVLFGCISPNGVRCMAKWELQNGASDHIGVLSVQIRRPKKESAKEETK